MIIECRFIGDTEYHIGYTFKLCKENGQLVWKKASSHNYWNVSGIPQIELPKERFIFDTMIEGTGGLYERYKIIHDEYVSNLWTEVFNPC